ncbi:MAG TPA: class I SAM-dependent methyltransferase [Polyangiaceae bacterium]|nr:class I SAM-dependent methyltransferase [Polyangiaceae bacterium]
MPKKTQASNSARARKSTSRRVPAASGARSSTSERKRKSPAPRVAKAAGQGTRRKAKKARLTAATADRHVLYQKSVQDAAVEIDFIDRTFKKLRKRPPLSLREDFCGTGLLTTAWVASDAKRTGIGVDIDPEVLAWGKKHNLEPLGEEGARVSLRKQDVRTPPTEKVDVVVAFNFSYWIFMTREEMRKYFALVRKSLKKDGVYFLDAYGGWESHQPMQEPRSIRGGFKYVWDQATFDPITHRAENHIHFRFPDGTEMEKAFSYTWRFWSLPEIQELLQEAGFSKVQVYWDTSEDENEENYKPVKHADNHPGWLAYIVAQP